MQALRHLHSSHGGTPQHSLPLVGTVQACKAFLQQGARESAAGCMQGALPRTWCCCCSGRGQTRCWYPSLPGRERSTGRSAVGSGEQTPAQLLRATAGSTQDGSSSLAGGGVAVGQVGGGAAPTHKGRPDALAAIIGQNDDGPVCVAGQVSVVRDRPDHGEGGKQAHGRQPVALVLRDGVDGFILEAACPGGSQGAACAACMQGLGVEWRLGVGVGVGRPRACLPNVRGGHRRSAAGQGLVTQG